MRPHRTRRILALLIAAASPSTALAISGGSLALKSTGSNVINQNGYVGTYITLAAPATVTLTVNAQSASGGGATPHMNIVVDDSVTGFDVGTSATDYNAVVSLPAGTHFVRTELNNYASRSLTVNTFTTSGATIANTANDTNATNAANTYIANYRQGPASVQMTGLSGVVLLPGTSVNVDLARHAFNFGGNVPGNTPTDVNTYLASNPVAGSTAAKFQTFINSNFNMLVPSNAGKWQNNEFNRNNVTMSGVDEFLNYAQSHNMRARMHNLLWGDNSFNGQQPSWVLNDNAAPNNGLLDKAYLGDSAAANDLRNNAITSRINYYVGTGLATDRAKKYAELDVYNESYHTGLNAPATPTDYRHNYWNVYGASGIASIYNQVQTALNTAGSSAKIYMNEYNILQWGDVYANWYRQHIESVRGAGGAVSGIGVQYYVDTSSNANTNSPRSASRIMSVLQGLSVAGLPMTLTEYSQQSGGSGSTAQSTDTALHANILEESMRMMFGTPQMQGFLIWGWWGGATDSLGGNSTLVDSSWNLTANGTRWESLLNQWHTTVTPIVGADGKINFTGYYGDYNVGGQSSALTLNKGTTTYSLGLTAPPTWSLWKTTSSGAWGTASNWTTGGIADAAGQTAYFGTSAGSRSVSVDASRTLGMIVFDSANAYALSAGGGTITMQGFNNASGHVAAINVVSGNHSIAAPLALAESTTVAVTPAGSTLTLSNLQTNAAPLTKSGSGTLMVNNVRGTSLTVSAGAVNVLPRASGGGTSKVTDVSVAPGAMLDLADNSLVTHDAIGTWNGAAYTGVLGQVASAYNNGSWNGSGIGTSVTTIAGSSALAAIAVATADETGYAGGSFGGVSASSGDVLLMYTYAGDATLNGRIDSDDYFQIDSNYGHSGSSFGYYRGDFNYSGTINGDDYFIIDSSYVGQGSQLSPASPGSAGVTATPEPSALLGAIVLAAGSLARRRRPT